MNSGQISLLTFWEGTKFLLHTIAWKKNLTKYSAFFSNFFCCKHFEISDGAVGEQKSFTLFSCLSPLNTALHYKLSRELPLFTITLLVSMIIITGQPSLGLSKANILVSKRILISLWIALSQSSLNLRYKIFETDLKRGSTPSDQLAPSIQQGKLTITLTLGNLWPSVARSCQPDLLKFNSFGGFWFSVFWKTRASFISSPSSKLSLSIYIKSGRSSSSSSTGSETIATLATDHRSDTTVAGSGIKEAVGFRRRHHEMDSKFQP